MKTTGNREQLLTTALQLFAEQGYASVGVQEICSATGVTKPTLYHYFGSKDGLLAAVLEADYPDLLGRLNTGSTYRGDLVQALTGLFTAWFDFVAERPDFVALQLSLIALPRNPGIQAQISPWQKQFRDVLLNLFQAAGPQHGNLIGHEALLASALQGLLQAYALDLLNGSLMRSDDFVYKTVKQYMYGIYVL